MPRKDAALDKQSLEANPNAFLASDGRTLYKYKMDDGSECIMPRPIEEMTEQDFYNLPIMLGDQQMGRLPQNLTVTFKDPQWAGHWFNKKAGSGARVSTARSLGFVPAKVEDLESYHVSLNDKDGALEDNDLVLMKIHKIKLFTKFAEWISIAKSKGSIGAYKANAEGSLSPANRDKVPYYHTPQATGEYQGLGPVVNLPEVQR